MKQVSSLLVFSAHFPILPFFSILTPFPPQQMCRRSPHPKKHNSYDNSFIYFHLWWKFEHPITGMKCHKSSNNLVYFFCFSKFPKYEKSKYEKYRKYREFSCAPWYFIFFPQVKKKPWNISDIALCLRGISRYFFSSGFALGKKISRYSPRHREISYTYHAVQIGGGG